MTDVYNRGVFERNSIQDVPPGYIDDSANNLYRFLGSFWRNIHEGRALVKGLQDIRGVKAAQFYLDLLESLKLQDRKGMPVFHRELWKPLIIRLSGRDKANENVLRLGGGVDLGPQGEGSKYGEGTQLKIGTKGSLKGYVTYPVEGDIEAVVSGVTNNVINPTVVYKVAQDFPSDDVIYMNGTLIFPEDKDPFAPDSGFDVYDVGDIVKGASDRETVVWASDALVDKDYIADHMAYAIGVDCESTDIAKRIMNAEWDAINCGLTPELFRTLVAAIVNIPVVQEADETVLGVAEREDGSKLVKTDKHSYTVFGKAKLRDCIASGTVLHRGDFLDQSVKVYPLLTDVSPEKLAGTTEYADIIKVDVPVVSMPRTILRTKTSNGLFVDWVPTDILWDGGYYGPKDVDHPNGYRKLYFDIGGPEEDVKAFWEDVWAEADRTGVDLDDVFADCEYTESSSSSPDSWQIIPAAFFLQHMLGANTLIVTFDRDQVEEVWRLHDNMFFDLINKVMPDGMRLFFVEHVSAGDKGDECYLGENDEAEPFVLEEAEDEVTYNSLPGMKGKRMPTYEDQVEMKFLRNRKRNAD